ncbi:MAG: cold shock domain-containing protein [Chloroflexi bacterium]|nr:cold shock domain-containing protein [Chloroflexota bacterium]
MQYERQEQLSREYDRAYVDGATTKDLDLQLLDSVGKQIASGYSPEKLLQFLDLAVHTNEGGLRLTRAALLLFAKEIARWHPRCEVRILRIAGAELGTGPQYNVTQDDVIRGNITAILEKAWESLRPYLARTRFHGDAVFRESIMYPDVACREGLVNAIAHRDYSAEGRPVEILVFEDRLEIKSPGSLLSSIKLESLVRLERPHQSRNVLIARVLRELGYMREMGEGIPRIFHTMRESDLVDPELRSEANAFVVILRNTSVFSPRDVEWLKAYADFDLDRNEQKVVLLGRDSHLLSTNEIIRLLGIVDMDVFRALYEKMRRKGVIFNAKPRSQGSGVRRREEGRFQIRPPSEAQQYLNELLAQVQPIVAARVTLVPLPKSITEGLSPGSPYRENPSWGLHDLGFIDNRGQWLPKAKALVPAPQPAAKPTVMPASGQAESRKQGVIRWKNEMQGFGFISGTDGQEYYMHASFLAPPLVWKELSLGTKVSFRVAERQIAGRARATADIRLDS